jgi:hypothetical protein
VLQITRTTEEDLRGILDVWIERLELRDWEIRLDLERPADGARATIYRSAFYREATLLLEHDWRTWEPAVAEVTIVHELVHLLARDFEEILKMIDAQLPPAVDKVIEQAFEFRLEQLVDTVARRLVSLAPTTLPARR